jgi:hypothetical protein
LGEEYKSWSFSIWSFLHSPVTSSLLGPDNENYIIAFSVTRKAAMGNPSVKLCYDSHLLHDWLYWNAVYLLYI